MSNEKAEKVEAPVKEESAPQETNEDKPKEDNNGEGKDRRGNRNKRPLRNNESRGNEDRKKFKPKYQEKGKEGREENDQSDEE